MGSQSWTRQDLAPTDPQPQASGWHSPGDRDSRPSPLGYLGSRSGYRGKSALPHTPRSPHLCEGHGPGGQPGGQNPPPSRRIAPSRCTCIQPGSSAGGPHSTQPGRDRAAFTSLHNPPPPAPGGLGSGPGQAGGHSREATGSRPSPHSGLGSRSAPQGSWCAGHSPCLCDETGQPGGQASSAVQSPSCSTSDTAPRPSTCSHGGSSARGLSSRQPGGRGWQHRVVWEAAMWGGKLSPCLPRLPFLLTAPPAGNEPNRAGGPPVGQAEDGGAKQQESDHPPRPRHCRPPPHAPPLPHAPLGQDSSPTLRTRVDSRYWRRDS